MAPLCSLLLLLGTAGFFAASLPSMSPISPLIDHTPLKLLPVTRRQLPGGARTDNVPRPPLGSVPYGVILERCTVPGTVALTFDDGPSEHTAHVLELLARFEAKATFFVNGLVTTDMSALDDEAAPWAALVRRMRAAGHQIGSHTWSHQDLAASSPAVRVDELVRNKMALRNLFGDFPTYMRPPFAECPPGSGCPEALAAHGYHMVYYDIDTLDYAHATPDLLHTPQHRFVTPLREASLDAPGHIVLAHDSHAQTAHSLTEYMLTTLRGLGFQPVTVGDCLGDPPENWYRNGTTGQATRW